ncbi:MAG: hypothetical protein PHG54_08200 [Smithellaceae bacterium]|nr:hypothetical protein [Syntrophaceae bacterium]MDD4241400.1 hypothetical protein [Smithellaceae bacterium]NLX51066.1 hypothetical protein [Deltaproteobacteria bacterium]
MRHPFLLLFLACALLNPFFSPAQTQSPAAGDNLQWTIDATKKYSPVSWALLMQYDRLPRELDGARKGGWAVTMRKSVETFQQLQPDNGKTNLLSDMSNNISCITLALQRLLVFRHTRENKMLMDWDRAEAFFDLPPGRSFYVTFPLKALFPSPMLAPEIPEDLRTPLFSDYIEESEITKRFGVVGLLEEYHAHYNGARYYLDMLDAFKTAEGSDIDGFLEWVRHSKSKMTAFYEFDFFILEYLRYMRENRAADYAALKAHRPFGAARLAIRSSYEDVIRQYLQIIEKEMERLNGSGTARTGMEGNVLWIRPAGSNLCKGARVLPDREKLMPVLAGDRYQTILKDFPER